ncbi:MAG: phenylacetic acid degradation operon negative regulatory protein [Ilumatobacter sp.]|jgi:phenylacetic acid degradation operon negative regulatory protein
MIHFWFIMNTISNIDGLEIAPFSARSVILSALLGSHPPVLPVQALIRLAELFDIRSGTARTSLSRMVANGELTVDEGRYALAGRLLERQREQDAGRHATTQEWDGEWITAIASGDRRTMAERRAFRQAMIGSRLAELRPDIWLRPANVENPPRPADVIITRGAIEVDDTADLVDRLWPLAAIDARSQRLIHMLTAHRAEVDRQDDRLLPTTFTISAAAVRFLRTEPQLPDALLPNHWSARELRPLYDDFARAFDQQLRRFFASE